MRVPPGRSVAQRAAHFTLAGRRPKSPRVRTVLRPAFAALVASLLAASACAAGAGDALLRPHELRGWDALDEAAVDPAADPDLVEWGVRALHVRHYTRDWRGVIQVCSVEIWEFAGESQAAAAAAGFSFPDWRIDRVGVSLVMVRGLLRARDVPPVRGVFPECEAIGARIRDRLD